MVCGILLNTMGERILYQPLTKGDKITVILYRTGILISALIICLAACLALSGAYSSRDYAFITSGAGGLLLVLLTYFSVGLSVFFIHLYVGRFHRILKNIFYIAVLCLGLLLAAGKGNPAAPLFSSPPISALLLIPLSLCLGFVTAKEAFCFRILEGYLLAGLMPAYIFFYAVGALSTRNAALGLGLIAALAALFVIRKVFMPLHFDIGDKSAYQA